MTAQWPTIELDPVRRMRVLATAVTGAALTERVIDADYDVVCAVLGDLEHELAAIQPDVRAVRVERHGPSDVVVHARSRFGMRASLRGITKPGWCWLQSRFLLVGMAASREPDGRTRVAFTGGVRVPTRAALVPVGVRRASRKAIDRLTERVARRA